MQSSQSAARAAFLTVFICVLSLTMLAARQQAGGARPDPSSQPAFEGTAAVSGVVTDATTKQPIPGVLVYLGFQGRGAVGRLSRQISDDKGRFVFTDLPAGNNFFINAYKLGYVEGHYGVGAGGLLGGLITLTDGQWFSEANVVMSRLGAISGTITDERGDPAVGVFVRVLTRINVAGQSRLASGQVAKTDDRGVYRLADLLPGRYVVQVPNVNQTFSMSATPAELAGLTPEAVATGRTIPEPPVSIDLANGARLIVGGYLTPPAPIGGRPQVYPALFYPGTASIGSAGTIDLRAGDERTGINITLHPVSAATLSGLVDGPADVLSGTRVRLLPEGLEELGHGSETATATLGADGRFTFANVPTGSYLIDVRPGIAELQYRQSLATVAVALPQSPGGLSSGGGAILSGPRGTSVSLQTTRGSAVFFARQRIRVDAGTANDLRVTLQKGASIRGRFVTDTNEPASQSAPVPVRVQAEPADGNLGLGMYSSTSQAPMTFEIQGLPPGQFLLRFLGIAGAAKSVAGNDGVDHLVKPFDTSTGQDFDVVVTITSKRIDLSGSAADGKGAQVKNAIVIAFPVDRTLWSNYGLSPMMLKSSPTTSSGTYRFQSLPAGEYFLIGVPPDQAEVWQDPANLQKLAPLATRVTLAWGEAKVQSVTVVRLQ